MSGNGLVVRFFFTRPILLDGPSLYVELECAVCVSVITSKMIIITARRLHDESYSKIIRGHKYKDKDNDKDNYKDKDKDKDKDTDKVTQKPNTCYIFEILMTYSFQI